MWYQNRQFLYQLPSIEFDPNKKLIITINFITIELKLYGGLVYVEEINHFINMLNTNTYYKWFTFELTKDNIILQNFDRDVKINIISTPETRSIVKEAFIKWSKYVEDWQLLNFKQLMVPYKSRFK